MEMDQDERHFERFAESELTTESEVTGVQSGQNSGWLVGIKTVQSALRCS